MSLSVDAFNGVMDEFLSQLLEILGESEPGIKDAYNAFKILTNDPQKRKRPLELFMTKVSPYAELVQQMDERFILEHCTHIPFISNLHVDRHWKEFDDDQKKAMWQFLNMMLMLGSTILSVPEEMMTMVEGMASQMFESGMLSGDGTQSPQMPNINIGSMMHMFMGPGTPLRPNSGNRDNRKCIEGDKKK